MFVMYCNLCRVDYLVDLLLHICVVIYYFRYRYVRYRYRTVPKLFIENYFSVSTVSIYGIVPVRSRTVKTKLRQIDICPHLPVTSVTNFSEIRIPVRYLYDSTGTGTVQEYHFERIISHLTILLPYDLKKN